MGTPCLHLVSKMLAKAQIGVCKRGERTNRRDAAAGSSQGLHTPNVAL
jgi:hypothetical protein